jgi:hypothetical protein
VTAITAFLTFSYNLDPCQVVLAAATWRIFRYIEQFLAGEGAMAKLPSRSDAEVLFWRVMRLLLILGFVSLTLTGLLLWRPTADNQIGQALAGPIQHLIGGWSDPVLRLLGVGVWAGAIAFCALLLKDISRRDDLLKALAAMWRPVVLVVAAGYVLFFNDQGRELGVSLLGEKSVWPISFLFLALIYWAANTWHTARLGIHAAVERHDIPVPKGDERWLYWPPRLLGVCAHFFAAINLSLAAWGLPLPAWADVSDMPDWMLQWLGVHGWLKVLLWLEAPRWLAWTAPLAILLATVFVWAADVEWSSRGKKSASANKAKWARRVGWAAIVGEFLLLGGLAYVALHLKGVPQGFLLGTISISFSAVAFLGFISWLRNLTPPLGENASAEERAKDDVRQQEQIEVFTIGLFVVALLVAALVWLSPTQVGGFLGSMVVAYFAFGAILALVNAFEFAVVWTTKRQWFGEMARPNVVGAYAVAFVVGLAVLNAWLHPFHRVRLCDGGDCVSAILPEQRPTVAAAARAWYEQVKPEYAKAHGDEPVPMFIVATAGGGIRAAYWTATILEGLEKDFEAEGGSVRPYLFAISGVSGGSVGATAFEAALTQRDENQCKAGKQSDEACPLATDFLKEDFLAPALASLFFRDTPSSFLPDFGQDDRGATLERTFEHASGGLLARPFLNLFSYKEAAITNGGTTPPWRPVLLLNATHEETGNRIITGPVQIDRNVFLDSLDALHVLRKDVRASTAAHNSARFTYVSPAGDLGNGNGSVIDGGYFENYGALSALELARASKEALKDEKPGVKLVFLLISSDPGLDEKRTLVRINERKGGKKCLVSVAEREGASSSDGAPNYLSLDPHQFENAWFNEFVAPLQGVTKVREAHGNRAAAELAVEICTEFPEAPKVGTGATQTAAALDSAKDVGIDDSEPLKAKFSDPYFAHLAMCKDAPIQPPLGWVLSKATQDRFADLLGECGNDVQLRELEIALGKEAAQHDASR